MPHIGSSALSLLAASPLATAWGTVGHATVGTIAQHYLTPAAQSYVSGLLGSGVTMASVASWADDYRYTTAGKFSAPFHYIDAEDSPPSSCSVDLNRDCGTGGCVVSAIANYTQIVNDGRRTLTNRKQALEFLIHFLGDITQPLHDEAEKVGGNQIPVLWNGEDTNLHATWDTQMVEKDAGGNSASVITAFSNKLITAIDSGAYSSQKASWVSCNNIKTASTCALQWAADANKINCQYVLKVDETNQELSGSYYTGAKPYIELQLAKGGYRLGAWVNALAAAA
ncbi:MAG: hypothetical protein LQ351_005110 [Letrouitia transgressa]|nr:MAG: hypothetical protein LQ351_005110 [Letrouitia transgressa]